MMPKILDTPASLLQEAGMSAIAGQAARLGGAAADLFAGFGATTKADLAAQGLRLTAQGTLITAQGTRLNAEGLRTKAQGDLAEASNYDLAATLAQANEAYTAQSTRIQQSQQERAI